MLNDIDIQSILHFQIEKSIEVKQSIIADKVLCELISDVCMKAINVYRNGKKTLIAGNGGSAADAQHIAGEFVGRYYFDRPALPALALTTDTSILTAVGNDHGFERIFARQIEANGSPGDMFIAISTSGSSKNILEALKACQGNSIITVGLTGQSGGSMADLCDYCLKIPSTDIPRIQESQMMIGHIICSAVEKALFGQDS